MSDMVETLAYAGQVPWHGKGLPLGGRVTAGDMLAYAGLDWEVEAQPLYTIAHPLAAPTEVPGRKALVRRPHGNVLADVSDDYGIVQNREIAGLAEAMGGDGPVWEIGGSLDDGRRVFFCGVLDEQSIADDAVRNYLTLASSHDGSLAVTAAFTPIRVVCANTLGAMLGASEGRNRITIRHTKSAADKVKLAATLCRDARAYFGAFHEQALGLVGATLSVVDACEMAATLVPAYKSEDTGRLVTPALQGTIVELFKRLSSIPQDRHIAGTRWGFYQAVTAALDHNRKGSGDGKLRRFLSGSDDTLRSRAWRMLTGK